MATSAMPPARASNAPDRLRRRMEAIRATGPVDHALDAGLLALDVTNAYRQALLARDAAAAYLHDAHGWTFAALARVIDGGDGAGDDRDGDGNGGGGGDRSGAARIKRAAERVHAEASRPGPYGSEPAGSEPAGSEPAGSEPAESEPVGTQPGEALAELRRRQTVVADLRRLVSDARRLAATHILGRPDRDGWPRLGLPADRVERIRAIAGQLRLVDIYMPALEASRNAAAAALVANAGWSLPEIALIARTSPARIVDARDAIDAEVVSYPDPGTVSELADVVDALAPRRYALGELQQEAMLELLADGMAANQIAALAQVQIDHVERLRPVTR